MKKVILIKGLPGSGKSTLAKKMQEQSPSKYKRINKDELRRMLDNGKWSKSNEKFILRTRDSLILQALEEGYDVIVDDTNLHRRHRSRIEQLIEGKAELEIIDLTNVPIETCIENDLKRLHSVGEKVIRRMHRQFLYKAEPTPEYNEALPEAIICDIDGTLAIMNGRSPYDPTLYHTDLPNEPIINLLNQFDMYPSGPLIIIVSGRDNKYRKETMEWLNKYRVYYNELHMRPENDNRKDWIIKTEIYEKFIKDRFNVNFILDDRTQVVEQCWRRLGLPCLQVNYGDF